jgi:hypothetical protein
MLTYMEPLQEEEHQEDLVEEEEVQVVIANDKDSEEAPTGAMEEQSVNNLLDSGGEEGEGEEQDFTEDVDDDGSETLVPPPPKPTLPPILPLYTNQPPFNKPLRGNRRMPLQNKNLNRNLLPQKRPANKTTPPSRAEEEDDVDTQALMDFSTQTLMGAASNFTDRRLPPPRP